MALLLHAGTVFLGAALLFLVQPMIAKAALPRFGGGAAVWTTSLVLFQSLLLAGYAFSHQGAAWLGARRQLVLHVGLVLASLATLPPALGAAPLDGGAADAFTGPALALVLAVAAAVGPPFFVLACSSSLVQRWYALGARREPWFLYAASNAGSLAALLAYPLLVEPWLGMRAQARLFAAGYGVFAALTVALASVTWGRLGRGAEGIPDRPRSPAPGLPRRLRWIARSAVGSLLLLGVSLSVTTDVAAVPLLWVVPLALYLTTWILAFASLGPSREAGAARRRARLSVGALVAVVLALGFPTANLPLALALPPPLLALLLGGWVCHADLAADRPGADRLTSYYLHTAFGGFVGGVAGAVLPPLLSSHAVEYPLSLAFLVVAIVLGGGGASRLRDPGPARGVCLMLAAGALALAAVALPRVESATARVLCEGAPVAVLLFGLALWRVWPEQLAVGALLVAAVVGGGIIRAQSVRASSRSFYGVLRVLEGGGFRSLVHGTTIHGAQRVVPHSPAPVSYYHEAGPIAAALRAQPPSARVGVVGLGTGATAALIGPGQRLTIYEIDPQVEPLARVFFTYLRDAAGPVEVVLGDARLSLAREPPGRFDALLVDAFSSDAVPVHLLTLDALRLYLDRVTEGGVVLLHVSNRHLDLARLVAGEVDALGVHAAIRDFRPDEERRRAGATACTVVAVARRAASLDGLGGGWLPLVQRVGRARMVVWTDERSSVLDLLR